MRLSITAQDLEGALVELSKQADLQLVMATSEVRGIRSAALTGEYPLDEALEKLLSGSGLTYTLTPSGTLTVMRASASQEPRLKAVAGTATQSATENDVLQEIIVTARKRPERLQDVPISIATVTGETLQNRNISTLSELAPTIPNFHYSEAVASSDQFILRGLGTTGVNEGFEQAVGQLIDGFYYGRSRFGRTMMLDLERVEVLKGPQGALIGKNTSVGAISYTTRKPGAKLGAYALMSYTFESDTGWTFEGATDLPVSDRLRVRFAGRWEDRNGWTRNAATGRDEQARRDLTLRATTVWELTDSLTSELMFQYGDLDRIGRNRELFNCVPDPIVNPTEDCVFNDVRNVPFVVEGEPTPETHDTRYELTHLTLRYAMHSATLSSLTSYATYDYRDRFDADWSALELSHFDTGESFRQFSQELRLTSTGEHVLDYIAGLYFNDNRIDFDQGLTFCRSAPAALIASCTWGPAYRGVTRNQSAIQNSQTFAAFMQADWHFAPQWTLTLGGRFTREDKDVTGYQRPTLPYQTDVPVDCPNVNDAFDGRGTLLGFPCPAPALNSNAGRFSRTAHDFSPNVTLRFKPRGNQMLYATFAQGFKSGGFTLWPIVAQAALDRNVSFGDEKTINLEVGGKHDLPDGRGRFNWAVWHTRFTDIQVSTLDPVLLVQTVSNAAQATSKGIEGDLLWSLHRGIALTASFAYTDARFDKYPGAPCYFSQTTASGCVGGVQDLAGVELPYAPKWQYSSGFNGTRPVLERFTLSYDLHYYWRGFQYLQLDHDPIDSQNAYGKLNATLSFGPSQGPWRMVLIGKNLTNELTANFSNDSAAVGATAGNPHFKFSEEPRSVTLQMRMQF